MMFLMVVSDVLILNKYAVPVRALEWSNLVSCRAHENS